MWPQEISEKCIRYDDNGDPEHFNPGSKLYKSYPMSHIIEIEEDFTTPITFTVTGKASNSEEPNPPDPAIIIKSESGKILICDDTEWDHGPIETLNTKDRVINNGGTFYPGFVAKKGTYYLEIWSYYQPMSEYEIVITENR